MGLDSYDGLFPNQDTLPQGEFGNLIALPLQKRRRERGHSVFLDERFVHGPTMGVSGAHPQGRTRAVRHLVQEAERRGRVLGVRLPPQKTATMNRGPCHSRRYRERPVAGVAVNAGAGAGTRFVARRASALGFGIASSGWRRFRTRSSTRRSRCGCRRTTSPASSRAPRTTRSTLAFHEAVSTT